jgi:hypothetical protein
VRRWIPLALLVLASCTLYHQRAEDRPVVGQAGPKGTLQYSVGHLSFLAPETWEARGDATNLHLAHPAGAGQLDAQQVEKPARDEAECLASAEDSLARGATKLTNVRRHASSFAGRRGVSQEADSGGWHGWAWAVCDGTTQYRVFFAGRSPVAPDVMDAWRTFTKSARLGGAR